MIDRVLRTWSLLALVFWATLAGAVAGAATNVQPAPTAAPPATSAADDHAIEHRRDTPQTSVAAVSARVMCPSCDATLDQSDSPAADRMRAWISEAVAAGWTESEIRDGLVREYGGDEAILAIPRSTSSVGVGAWLAPLLIVLAVAVLGFVVPRRWRRGQTALDSSSSHSSSA